MTYIEIMFGVLSVAGIGSVISNSQARRKELEFKALENKERRYKSCLLYMDVYFHPKNIKYLSSRQTDIHSAPDVIEYLKAEYHEMILYAAKPVLLSVKAFVEQPSREGFLTAALAMRRDLWSSKSDLVVSDVLFADRQEGDRKR
ncbi:MULTISPECIES: hypothetical protein [unclassified Lysobacter]|uniref:hypothetical protein n=1 Tax=unclassified Lysobacter TaxID=2635362 RepID=UPI0006F231D6|nr:MULTISPECIES: hypothetical protein [unclassified Lysobacter]KRC33935.1 hypothetical protein ASE10_13445 [Lysobacter sp. Root76]KRD69269.1 hypothetical protein ASE45_08885 [Lysobacter sp. Root96]